MKPAQKLQYPTEPLDDKERNYLLFIYRSRIRFFVPAILILVLAAALCSLYIAMSTRVKDALPVVPQACFNFLFIGLPIMLLALRIYYRRIYVYKRDLEAGLKEMIPYIIQEKESFPLTGQYYFKIDNPDNMHHEVDAATFNSFHTGDTVYIARAPKSKQSFEYGGRFSLI